jgi:nucleoside-diphosphate-sugar epimerase
VKILVTGSSGFIGTAVVQLLKTNAHNVLGLDRKPPKNSDAETQFFECDILNASRLKECLNEFQPSAVIHLAAKTSLKEVDQHSDHFAANTVGTENLMKAAEACGSDRRMLFTSTKYVYRGLYPPLNDRTYQPHTSYGHSKAEMERIIFDQGGGCTEWCIVRPTTIWGPGMGPHYQRLSSVCPKWSIHSFGYQQSLKAHGIYPQYGLPVQKIN